MNNKHNTILTLYVKELSTTKKSFIIWSIAISVIMLLNMLTYALLEANANMADVIMIGPILDYNYYFAINYESVMLVLCGAGMLFGANIFHKEETTGSIEFLYSTNISRLDIYIAKVSFVTTKLIVLAACALIISYISGCIVAIETMDAVVMLVSWLVSSVGILFFASLGFLLSSVLNRKNSATGICVGFTIGTYFLGILGMIGVEEIEFLEYFSPIHIMSATKVVVSDWGMGSESYSIVGFLVILTLTIGITVGNYFLYSKKDLQ